MVCYVHFNMDRLYYNRIIITIIIIIIQFRLRLYEHYIKSNYRYLVTSIFMLMLLLMFMSVGTRQRHQEKGRDSDMKEVFFSSSYYVYWCYVQSVQCSRFSNISNKATFVGNLFILALVKHGAYIYTYGLSSCLSTTAKKMREITATIAIY